MPDFLLEIGLEEVPARMVAAAEAELLRRVVALLERERLLGGGVVLGEGAVSFSSPRRLAVVVEGVLERQPDAVEVLNGPAVRVAFKEGVPGPAAEAFARKAGVAVGELGRVDTPKGEYLQARVTRAGVAAGEVLARELAKEIGAIYWPKNMYWRAGKPERFVRPVEWMLCLLDEVVVPVEFAGVTAGRATRGHRLLAGEAVEVEVPASYRAQLEGEYVLVDVEERRHRIRKELDRVTRTVAGARWREDEALVEQATHLVEWPGVLLGGFGEEFLELPEEVLVTVMRDHQKYFAVEGGDGKLVPYFLAVVNTELGERNSAVIRQGNERVLRARFNDARFFWGVDRKTDLMDRVAGLEKLTFHKDLGSYAAKSGRVVELAGRLAEVVGRGGVRVDVAALTEAATLAKADLGTELVKEFTELQGVIGGLYARAEGKPEVVWQAIYDQYMPAGVEGRVPRSVEGALLGIADRVDTIAGLFGLGLEPTGSKDPFGLRRAANAVVKMLAEMELPLGLEYVAKHAAGNEAVAGRMRSFFEERVAFYLREVRGFAYDVVAAVMKAGWSDLRDVTARASAVAGMRESADFLAVSAAFKRMRNILEQAAAKGEAVGEFSAVERSAVPEQAVLEETFAAVRGRVSEFVGKRQYGEALEAMATLRPAVDAFFDRVMVMDPDAEVRRVRLGLLAGITGTFGVIADFSEVVSAG